jgi:hypothetical protein
MAPVVGRLVWEGVTETGGAASIISANSRLADLVVAWPLRCSMDEYSETEPIYSSGLYPLRDELCCALTSEAMTFVICWASFD